MKRALVCFALCGFLLAACDIITPVLPTPTPNRLPQTATVTTTAPATPKTTALATSKTAAPTPQAATILLDGDFTQGALILVNRAHRVGNDWHPDGLVNLAENRPSGLVGLKDTTLESNKVAFDAMIKLLQGAKKDGLTDFLITSGYRSVDAQKTLYDSILEENRAKMSAQEALEATDSRCAPPGGSEHHTGLAFDLGMGTGQETFAATPLFPWMLEHCAEYGFILRFPENKTELTGYQYEPWHYRYVGLPHSQIMNDKGWCLEEYIAALRENPITYQDWRIQWAAAGATIETQNEMTVSGDGYEGFIVTYKK